MQVREIDLAREGVLLPPPPGVCRSCAVDHEPELPHDQTSLYWQYRFYRDAGRWPTWDDAMAHCTDEVKAMWKKAMAEAGVA